MSGPPDPQEADALRAWRDATLYRLTMRAHNAERGATFAALLDLGYGDVTQADMTLLANLDTEGTTISSLARRAGVSRQAASQAVVLLEAEGYVVRSPDPRDSRAVLVRRTERGRDLLADALRIVSELENGYRRQLGAEAFSDLTRHLTELLDRIDPQGALGRD